MLYVDARTSSLLRLPCVHNHCIACRSFTASIVPDSIACIAFALRRTDATTHSFRFPSALHTNAYTTLRTERARTIRPSLPIARCGICRSYVDARTSSLVRLPCVHNHCVPFVHCIDSPRQHRLHRICSTTYGRHNSLFPFPFCSPHQRLHDATYGTRAYDTTVFTHCSHL